MYVPPLDLTDPGAEARIVRETADEIVFADKHGWDYAWLTEHHFLRQFSHMSAPEVVFAAAAYATDHIRFGFGLALTPPTYNHPVRIAERAAMLDCLSNGRVDIGSGRSTTPAELYGFGLDPDESRAQWMEGLSAVAISWPRRMCPSTATSSRCRREPSCRGPVQKPHPPLWVGGVGPGNAERAAKLGLGMLFFANNTTPEGLHESVSAYKENIGNAEPFVAGGVNNQVAGFVNALCTTDKADRDRVRWLAATKMVEHTLHGSTYMTKGWPDEENLPASYAHVRNGRHDDVPRGDQGRPRRCCSPDARRRHGRCRHARRCARSTQSVPGSRCRPGHRSHADGWRPSRRNHAQHRNPRHGSVSQAPLIRQRRRRQPGAPMNEPEQPAEATTTPILDAQGVTQRFGGITAVDDVNLRVNAGTVHGLIGPNGAGKTTFFDCVAGVQKPVDGRILLDGVDVTNESAVRRARRGLRRTFQRQQVFGWLSVEDNVLLALEWRGGGGGMVGDLLRLPARRRLRA